MDYRRRLMWWRWPIRTDRRRQIENRSFDREDGRHFVLESSDADGWAQADEGVAAETMPEATWATASIRSGDGILGRRNDCPSNSCMSRD